MQQPSYRSRRDPALVAVEGDLDLASSRRVRERLMKALDESAGGLRLDLGGLAFCDCAGLNLLLELRCRALDQGKTFTVHAVGPAVGRLFDLTGVRELLSAPPPVRTDALRAGHGAVSLRVSASPPDGVVARPRPLASRVSEPA
ncbi:STAS domain-containing protein [Streptomyces aureus]|uniref:STAS domain-containing protein n=1 Tax=Streptomyces aureus TaxID=193461 RepID=UPI0033DBCCEE